MARSEKRKAKRARRKRGESRPEAQKYVSDWDLMPPYRYKSKNDYEVDVVNEMTGKVVYSMDTREEEREFGGVNSFEDMMRVGKAMAGKLLDAIAKDAVEVGLTDQEAVDDFNEKRREESFGVGRSGFVGNPSAKLPDEAQDAFASFAEAILKGGAFAPPEGAVGPKGCRDPHCEVHGSPIMKERFDLAPVVEEIGRQLGRGVATVICLPCGGELPLEDAVGVWARRWTSRLDFVPEAALDDDGTFLLMAHRGCAPEPYQRDAEKYPAIAVPVEVVNRYFKGLPPGPLLSTMTDEQLTKYSRNLIRDASIGEATVAAEEIVHRMRFRGEGRRGG